jgi:hypothetical protein
MPNDPAVEIIEVLHHTPTDHLKGHFRVEIREGGVLGLIGWVLGEQSQVVEVEVRAGTDVIASSAPGIERPDIAGAFPETPEARRSGFAILIEAQGSGESHLMVDGHQEDGTVSPIGEIRVKAPRRRWTEIFRPS